LNAASYSAENRSKTAFSSGVLGVKTLFKQWHASRADSMHTALKQPTTEPVKERGAYSLP